MVTRPRDRRQQVLAAAARLFWQHGFHRVGMSDIAAEVGIGASALYRHFRGKDDLLAAVVDESLDWLEAVLAAAPSGVEGTMTAVSEVVLARREFGVLWDREGWHLSLEQRRTIRRRLRIGVERVAQSLVADQPLLRARAITALMASVSYHRYDISAAELRRIAQAMIAVELPAVVAEPVVEGCDPQPVVSRREAVLVAASRLFASRGSASVSIADIGEAAGIAAPTVYAHFVSKQDLVVAALSRGTESMWLSLHNILRTADGPADALDRAIGDYFSFATANPDLVRLLLTEVLNVETQERTRREYAQELVALVQRARPAVSVDFAGTVVLGAIGIINAMTQVAELRGRPEIAVFARAILWS
ncbi:TetR family transcriptional regulator [Kutzneria sp. NPDC051319]|uniref:TetR/AcrR family transcriptional regulator n=1 Tax=Kutzneria sp. NPDC051319 TaxID=3155047 RepID=UPI0034493F34